MDMALELLDGARWRVMGGDRPFAVCRATPEEAQLLVDAEARAALEAWFAAHPRCAQLRGLLLFIENGDRVEGFVEMVVEDGRNVWYGPHQNRISPPRGLILLVEDDDDLRDTVASVLIRAGYGVVPARDGGEAMATLTAMTPTAKPDLIVLDLWMPGMDGRAFLAARAECPVLSEIPVIVTSGAGDRTAAEHGSSEFIVKPYTVDVLVSAVDRVCSVSR
jgi:CheY-like chemotaxis protein